MAGVAERFVNTVRELSESPVNINSLCTSVSKSFEGLLKCPVSHLDNAMETLAPEQHSIGILAIIVVKFQQLEVAEGARKYSVSDPAELDRLLSQTDTFIRTCNAEQVRCSTELFNDMLHHLTELLIERNEARRGIQIAANAVSKIRAFDSQLTTAHTSLCHLCLSARNFQPAIEFLDVDITDLHKVTESTTLAKSFLLYYYYGGMIYTAVKNYKRALIFFEIAICTPASVVSAIMVESYKKFLLVSLIVNRCEPSPLPKFVSPVVPRYIKPLTLPYHELATSYNTSIQTSLQTIADKHKTVYEQDNNNGLVKQCVKSLYKKKIQKLTKTFLTLSLADVANRVHLQSSQEAEKYLLHMIEDGEIYASISKKDGMVEFHDSPEKYNNPKMLEFLRKQENLCMAVNSKLEDLERLISVTPDYVSKVSAYTADDDSSSKASSSAGPSTSYK